MNKIISLSLISVLSTGVAFAQGKFTFTNPPPKKMSDFPAKFIPSPFEVIPLNSPVRGSTANFLLKVPAGFEIDKVQFTVKNANHFKDKQKVYRDIQLIKREQGSELRIDVNKLPPGFYQLYIQVKDKKQKLHEYKSKYHDHARFVISDSVEVPAPNEKLNNKTLQGIDSDGDGIRDDVQRYINTKYGSDENVKLALKQWAVAYQLVLTTAENQADSIASSYLSIRGIDCLLGAMDFQSADDRQEEIKSLYLNTLDRLRASKKASFNFHGQGEPGSKNKKTLCQFPID